MKPVDALTEREIVVYSLVVKGWRNARIAHELTISIRTVETHVSRILDKLGVASRTEAIVHSYNSDPKGRAQIEIRGISDDAAGENKYPLDIR
ncbi:MAG: response regulator transcription factor [Anaerolineae bacterium]|nr:response regulator transcription factor [Anaerolineae bacterium]